MKLKNISVATCVMRYGMTLRDFFEESVQRNVPGLPYVDKKERIVGRVSLRNVYKQIAVPDYLLRFADMIGDQTDNLDIPEMKVVENMASPIETFLLEKMPSVSSRSSVVKALALMEVYNSSYIFLIDEGEYKGVVTRMDLAKRMLGCVIDHEHKNPVLID